MGIHHLLLLLISIICCAFGSASSDQGSRVCISQGGRFPPFSLEGRAPRKSAKGSDDLTLCRIYRKKTCCTSVQTHPAFVSVRKLASSGEANEQCLLFWEAMECAICDPRVGVRHGPPMLCRSFCDSSFQACRDAFFAYDSMSQILQPCGPKDVICARASEWAVNGSQFCELAGFAVPKSKNVVESFCFDGKPNLDAEFTDSDTPGKKGTYRKQKSNRDILRSFMKHLDMGDVIVWAVGGLVLTAGIILMRHQRLSSQRKKASMSRLVQEARSKQQATLLATNKKNRK